MVNEEKVSSSEEVVQEKISDQDKTTLEFSKMNMKLALAQAEKALSENNAAELQHKYIILQLYMKYRMDKDDSLDEQGNIHRAAANKMV